MDNYYLTIYIKIKQFESWTNNKSSDLCYSMTEYLIYIYIYLYKKLRYETLEFKTKDFIIYI